VRDGGGHGVAVTLKTRPDAVLAAHSYQDLLTGSRCPSEAPRPRRVASLLGAGQPKSASFQALPRR
jgi:hypothetical protein